MEYVEMVILPIFSLLILFVLTKLMGYRQVSQLSMYDYIIGITIGSIATELVLSGFENLLRPLIAMLVYCMVVIFVSYVTTKNTKLRYFIEGRNIVLFEDGVLFSKQLNKTKMDIDEFLLQCRCAGYFDLSQIEIVILESNGKLSFQPKEMYRPIVSNDLEIIVSKKALPILVIKEGKIDYQQLAKCKQTKSWVEHQLRLQNTLLNDIVLGYYCKEGLQLYMKNNCFKVYK